jgi:hypothetical protein
MKALRRFSCTIGLLLMLVTGAFAAPASALEAKLVELRVTGGTVRASLEIRDMFPEKFRSVLEDGGAVHLRLQLELWEDRPVWDKLVQPAVVSVFRIALDRQSQLVSVADRFGEVSRQPAWQEPLLLRPEIARTDALSDGAKYYVRVLATLGTIAERETAQATNAVFGDDDNPVSLAGMGKMLFHAVLQVNEYLQSVSSEMRTRDISGRELKAGLKF